MRHPEEQYLDILREITERGTHRIDRTRVGTKAVFGTMMRFNLSDGSIPLFTCKKVLWQAALKEMLWFIRGETNIRSLLAEGVTIWTDWPLKKYRDTTGDNIDQKAFEARILADDEFAATWGDLGPVYGKQWRAWRDYDGGEIDQLAEAQRLIMNDPWSRRIIVEGWNVAELGAMALTPCHKSYQWFVEPGVDGKPAHLSLQIVQRSVDTPIGLPFNIAGGAFLLRIMADQCGLTAGDLVWCGGDTHIYDNQREAVEIMLARGPKAQFPKLAIRRKADDLFSYRFEDFEVTGYDHHPFIRMDVAV